MSGAYTAPPTRGEQDPDDGELSKMLRAAPELPSPGRALPPLPPPSGTSPAAKPGSGAREPWMWEPTDQSRERLSLIFVMMDRDAPGATGYDAEDILSHTEANKVEAEVEGISSTELEHMLINLGENVQEGFADAMVDLVDYTGDGQVEFDEFYAVMTGATPLDGSAKKTPSPGSKAKSSSADGKSIRQIRQQFDDIDEDGGGTLDKIEVSKLAEKMGKGLNRRHLVDAMKAMDPTDSGQVTFTMFKNWLIDTKEGRHWADFLVLPEGAITKLREMAEADDRFPPAGDAAAGWKRLSVLLQLFDELTPIWGQPSELYGLSKLQPEHNKMKLKSNISAADLDKEAKARACFFHPNQPFRTVWDFLQVVLLLYLLITVPLRIAFDTNVQFGSMAFWIDFAVDFYFWVDIFLNFNTAFYDSRGILEINRTRIAESYARSWLMLDVITCLPISYITMLIKWDTAAAASGKEVRVFKVLRLLKLSKLLRVTRIVRILERYREQLRIFMGTFGSIVLSSAIFFLAHIIACVWYYLGTEDQPEDMVAGTPGYTGWVHRNYGHPCADQIADLESASQVSAASATGGAVGVDAVDGLVNLSTEVCLESDISSRYITAIYWALMTISTVGYGDVTALTDAEKIGASLAMLFGALVFAAITGQMASRFMATKGAVQQFNTRMDEVRQYLHDKGVPIVRRRHIEAHFNLLWGKVAIYDEHEILRLLPRILRDPIIEDLYVGVLGQTPMFSRLRTVPRGNEVLTRIAQQLSHTVANFGLIIMREGEYGDELFFIESGEVDVYRKIAGWTPDTVANNHSDFRTHIGARLGRLGPGAFFGELATFTRGNGLKRGLRRRSVVSRSSCHFHVLHKRSLDALRREIPVLDREMAIVEEGELAPADASPSWRRQGGQTRLLGRGGSPREAVGVGDAGLVQLSAVEDGAMERRLQAQMKELQDKSEAQTRRLEAKLDTALETLGALAGNLVQLQQQQAPLSDPTPEN